MRFVSIVLSILSHVLINGNDINLKFTLQEECPIGYLVGTINSMRNFERISLSIFRTNAKIDNLFVVDSLTGDLRTNQRIDREEVCPMTQDCQIDLTILEILKNNSENWIKINISIIDMNDNRPKFLVAEEDLRDGYYVIEMEENNEPYEELRLPRVVDLDSRRNGQVLYRLENLNESDFDLHDYFDIRIDTEEQASLVVKKSLDYELKRAYQLYLVISEKNSPTDIGQTKLKILVNVIDVNDNKPTFVQPAIGHDRRYYFALEETTPVNSIILKVKAEDLDSKENGQIQYSLMDNDHLSYLEIGQHSGDVKLIKDVKAHVNNNFEFLVTATDGGRESHSQNFTLIIHVTDQNDHAPVISVKTTGRLPKDYVEGQVYIRENAIRNNEIVNLAVIFVEDQDVDKNGQVDCFIKQPDLYITEQSTLAKLELVESGKFSSKTLYKLMMRNFRRTSQDGRIDKIIEIICKDHGEPNQLTSSVNLSLRVITDKDFELKFDQDEYTTSIHETDKALDKILQVSILDSENSITYFFDESSRDSCPRLILNSTTGIISAPRGLDHEERDTLICRVIAREFRTNKETRANVVIRVIDVNDNTPRLTDEFLKNGLTIREYDSLKEDLLTDEFIQVGQLEARDEDSGINSKVDYSIISIKPIFNSQLPFYKNKLINRDNYNMPLFKLDKESGELLINKKDMYKVDRELISSFKMTVACRDRGEGKSLSSMQTFMINVIDINDNAPIWLEFKDRELDVMKVAQFNSNYNAYTPRELRLDNNANIYETIKLNAIDPDQLNGNVSFQPHPLLKNDLGCEKLPVIAYSISGDGNFKINKRHLRIDQVYCLRIRASDGLNESSAIVKVHIISPHNMIFSDDPQGMNNPNSGSQVMFKPYLHSVLMNRQIGLVFGISIIIIALCIATTLVFFLTYIKRKRDNSSIFTLFDKKKKKPDPLKGRIEEQQEYYTGNKEDMIDYFSTNKSLIGSSPIASTEITYHQDEKSPQNSTNVVPFLTTPNQGGSEFFEINQSHGNILPNPVYETHRNYLTESRRNPNSHYEQSYSQQKQVRYGSFTPSPIINDYRHYEDSFNNPSNVFYSPKLPSKFAQNNSNIFQQQSNFNNNFHMKKFISNSQNLQFSKDLLEERKFPNEGILTDQVSYMTTNQQKIYIENKGPLHQLMSADSQQHMSSHENPFTHQMNKNIIITKGNGNIHQV